MSTTADTVAQLAAAAASGGALGGLATAWSARKKAPAERDSIVVNSAETTVQAALAVASAQAERADQAEAEVRDLRARLDSALARVDALQTALDSVRDELYAIKSSHTDH